MKNRRLKNQETLVARLRFVPLLIILLIAAGSNVATQTIRRDRNGSHPSRLRESISMEEREMMERAIDVVCLERKRDSQGSATIDDMQGRPSLPVNTPEAIAGGRRAQSLLPAARNLVTRA